jgi:Zn-dependent protease with chaperone function
MTPTNNRWLSSTPTKTTTTTTTSSIIAQHNQSRINWHRWGRLLRYTRIPVLVVSVYGIGYQQGIMDTTRTPLAMQQGLLLTILKSVGVTHEQQVRILDSSTIKQATPEQRMVMTVGQQIVQAARAHVQEQLQLALQQAQQDNSNEMPSDMTPQQQLEYSMTQSKYAETIQLWYQAQLRLNGESDVPSPWSYVWIQHSNTPNAFVTEILPRRLFITKAMGQIATTPDEWAVVLGHEISHLILGHNSQTNQLEVFLKTVEVLLLSMDPTEGVFTVLTVGALAAVHRGLAAAYSREHERQADELGLVLAARACFDTARGIQVMHKMHQHSVSAAPSTIQSSTISLWDTHPPSLERYQQLQRASQTEHAARYTHCQTMTQRFLRAIARNPVE